MARKDKNEASVARVLSNLSFSCSWENYARVPEVAKVLSRGSKRGTGSAGFPDHVYENPSARLLVLVEDKPSVSYHQSRAGNDPERYAVDGIKWYLNLFCAENLADQTLVSFFASWRIVGVAFSGDADDEYGHRVSTYAVENGLVTELPEVRDLLCEEDYLALFERRDDEMIAQQVTFSSKRINRLLRTIDSQKRPILLSALMMCLYPVAGEHNDFASNYPGLSSATIASLIVPRLRHVLEENGIAEKRISVIVNELAFLATDKDLNDNSQGILRGILDELSLSVIPLFARKSNFDIVGRFYEEFLRFAGVANVKRGIVLTPRHVASLFVDLVDLKYNDVVVDFACGTGSFLIAAMNRLAELIASSQLPDKAQRLEHLKKRQLIGFEKNATMYTCALSNMMFHGDGKSNVFYTDCFSREADAKLEELRRQGIQPTVGFINPPYGGKDNANNPTKKEIQFIVRMLDSVSRFGVVIAPLSTFLKDGEIRDELLRRHTLRCVINMPKDLFMPNAAVETAIAVFETNRPQGDQPVTFAAVDDDGFVLDKGRGRSDVFGRWRGVRERLLADLADPSRADGVHVVRTQVRPGGEWLLQAYAAIDYSVLTLRSFERTVKERIVYLARRDMGLPEGSHDEIDLVEAVEAYCGRPFTRLENRPVDVTGWRPFRIGELFDLHAGTRLTKKDMLPGELNFLGAIKGNNGVREHILADPLFLGDTLTVNYNGSVGETFYQSEPYWPSDDVYTLTIKPAYREGMGVRLGMFLATVIKLHRQNYFYGRKWSSGKMLESEILLPVDADAAPDWAFMERFIDELPLADLLR